ncbi:MAG: MBL fold metallo-hydrolase [Clostridia bacterium]|nr:MBL fold metallo-hydrolase [Clostridia bacterium]
MARKKEKKFNAGIAVLLAVCCLAVGVAGGYYGIITSSQPTETEIYSAGSLKIHFLELGNKYTGDCTYIKAGDTDILIDAGSRTSSIPTISAYLDRFVTDRKLEYVIVTHAHQDHYAGFATNIGEDSLFDLYECGTIIDFAMTNQEQNADKDGDGFGENMYSDYLRERADEVAKGATHYTAAQCIQESKNEFALSDTATLTILDQKFYYEEAETENDYSVCALITEGADSFLFTGDLEKDGEESLVERNSLPQVSVYKAGHHGSKTSSHDVLLDVIKPSIVCVCCCAGSSEYTDKQENQFPTQDFIDRVSKHTDAVYVTTLCTDYDNDEYTSMNGNIVISYAFGSILVECSASDTKLKDTAWFKANRTVPDSWK